jgi:excisionase family DNA binding protein
MDDNRPEPLLCSIENTTRILGVSRTTVYQLVKEGRLRQVKVGRRALITSRSIIDYVDGLSS